MIWMAKPSAPVEIRAYLDNAGLGWFALKRLTANGPEDVRRIDAEDADGNAAYQIPTAQIAAWNNQPALFKMRVLVATGQGEEIPLFLDVRQGGATLPALDGALKPSNGSKTGASYRPVELGALKAGQNGSFNFDIWFD